VNKKAALKRIRISIKPEKIYNFYILYLIFGFIFAVFISIVLKSQTNTISAIYRLSVPFLSCFFIVYSIRKKHYKLNKWFITLIFFLIFFLIRAIYSFEILGFSEYSQTYTSTTIYFFIAGSIILPIIAISLSSQYFNIEYFNKHFLRTLIICGLLILVGTYIRYEGNILGIIAERYLLWDQKAKIAGSVSSFNPILISRFGALLIFTFSISYNQKHFYKITGIFLGLILFAVGGSRGPIFALFFTYIIYFFVNPKRSFVKIALFSTVILFISFVAVVPKTEISLFERFNIEELRNLGNRADHWKESINTIIKYPLFGNQIWQGKNLTYPHNLFLEASISTGILGLSLLLISLLKTTKNIFLSKNNPIYRILTFTFILQTLFTMFSGAIYSNFEFWYFLALTLSLKQPATNKPFIHTLHP
jgi:O-antigen ligase